MLQILQGCADIRDKLLWLEMHPQPDVSIEKQIHKLIFLLVRLWLPLPASGVPIFFRRNRRVDVAMDDDAITQRSQAALTDPLYRRWINFCDRLTEACDANRFVRAANTLEHGEAGGFEL